MNQTTAVDHALLSIDVFQATKSDIRSILEELYIAGWEEGRRSTTGSHQQPVRQLDHRHIAICVYPTIKDAVVAMKCNESTIIRALNTGKRTHKGHYWERINK